MELTQYRNKCIIWHSKIINILMIIDDIMAFQFIKCDIMS